VREKYIEDRIPRWFVFGEYDDTGNVDVADPDMDVWEDIPRRVADALVEARGRYVDEIVRIVKDHPNALWNYNGGKRTWPMNT
jgi:hypothetical protein